MSKITRDFSSIHTEKGLSHYNNQVCYSIVRCKGGGAVHGGRTRNILDPETGVGIDFILWRGQHSLINHQPLAQ